MNLHPTLRVPADLGRLSEIRDFLRKHASVRPEDRDALEDLVCAVDEAVTNVVVHGYRGEPGDIEIELAQEAHGLIVRLRDQAPPFDPTSTPPPDVASPLEERAVGGLGVHLTRHLVDEMTHRALSPQGNELTLVKRIAGRRGGPTPQGGGA
jgi:serine/threonine-protein kinase RsbW